MVYIVKSEELEHWLTEWVEAILRNIGDHDLIVSTNVEGTCSAPSKRKHYYRTPGFTFGEDVLKEENIKPILESSLWGFIFMKSGKINFDKYDMQLPGFFPPKEPVLHCKKMKIKVSFLYEKAPRFETEIDRQNPSVKQIREIQRMANHSIGDEIKRIMGIIPEEKGSGEIVGE